LPNLAVLLADAGLVLKPDFNRRRFRQSFEMSTSRARGKFYGMARPSFRRCKLAGGS